MKPEALETAKGLGIVLVVLGHSLPPTLATWIFTFHMPFFFLLSGITLRPRSMRDFAAKKVNRLAIPYVSFLVLLNLVTILGFIKSILTGSYTTEKHQFYAGHFLTQIRGGSDLTGTLAVFWFPPCLAFSLLIAGGALKCSRLAALATTIVFLTLISAFAESIRELPSTLGLKSSFGAIPLILIGRTLYNDRWTYGRIISAAVVIIAAFICRIPLADLAFNMKYADFGTIWYSFPFAVAMSSVVLFIAGHLGDSQFSIPIRYLGRASMTIMYLHMFVLLTPVLYIVPREARIFLALLLPAAVHLGFERHPVSQRLFLGQVPSGDRRSVSMRGAV